MRFQSPAECISEIQTVNLPNLGSTRYPTVQKFPFIGDIRRWPHFLTHVMIKLAEGGKLHYFMKNPMLLTGGLSNPSHLLFFSPCFLAECVMIVDLMCYFAE